MKRTVLTDEDPRLREVAAPVAAITPELRQLIKDMEQTMRELGGIGLAAPQVGIPLRIIVACSNGDPRGLVLTFVNPEILTREGEQTNVEGCLSVPGKFGGVSRAAKIQLRAMCRRGAQGRPFTHFTSGGFEAACIQHEIDHLDGILFVDRLAV